MGSGLVKCFVSNQVIPERIPVVLFPIIQASGYEPVKVMDGERLKEVQTPNSTTVYSNCLYGMQGVYFTAKADDYGRSILDFTQSNQISMISLLRYLHKESLNTLKGDNEYHEMPFNINSFLEKHNIVIGKQVDKSFNYLPFTNKNLLKKLNTKKMNEIFEELLELGDKNRIYVGGYNSINVCKFSICLKSVFEYSLKEQVSFSNTFKEKLKNKLLKIIGDHYDNIFIHMDLSRLFFSDAEMYSNGYYDYTSEFIHSLPKKITKKHINSIINYSSPFIEILDFQRYLNQMEILIQPITGYNQDYYNEIGNNYLKLVKMANKSVKDFNKQDR